MNISARCDYGCRAVVELTRQEGSGEPLSAVAIAGRRHIPEKYLVHILLQLKRAGLVRSIRGAQGGYLMGRPAETITLLDIVRAIDGPVLDPLPLDSALSPELEAVWRDVAARVEQVLASVSARDIVNRAESTDMYFI